MFGIFKKKNYTKELLTLVFSQNDTIEKLATLMPVLADMALEKNRREECEIVLENICGEWICNDIGISIQIRKEKSGFYASIRDVGGLEYDFKISYAIRTYKGMSYFVVDSYAIFIEYDKEKNEVFLAGNLSLVCKAAAMSLYRAIPFDFNPN